MRFPVFQPQILRVVLKTYGMLSFLDFLYSFNMGRPSILLSSVLSLAIFLRLFFVFLLFPKLVNMSFNW